MVIHPNKILSPEHIIYSEKTNLIKRWLYLVMAPVIFITYILLTTTNISDDSYFIYFLFLVLLLFFFSKLKFYITGDGHFKYKFPPYKFWYTEIKREDILHIEIEPNFKEFWGFGIRFSKKYSISYALDTKFLLIITTKNNKKQALSVNNKIEIIRIAKELGIAVKEEGVVI